MSIGKFNVLRTRHSESDGYGYFCRTCLTFRRLCAPSSTSAGNRSGYTMLWSSIAACHNAFRWSLRSEKRDVVLFKRNRESALEHPVVDNTLCGPAGPTVCLYGVTRSMDVFLRRQLNGNYLAPKNTQELEQSIALHARTPLELLAEVADLRKRRVGLINVRRQQVMRLGVRSLLHVLADNDLQVGTVGYAGGFTGSLGRSYEDAVQDTYRALELAATLSARSLVVVPGSRQKHIYSHASKTIKAGLDRCLDDALRFRIDLQIALSNVIRDRDDVFVPDGQSPLQWIEDMDSHRMKGMMVLRGASPWTGMPDCWRRCLLSGGILRLSRSCCQLVGGNQVMEHIIQGLSNVPVVKKQSAAFSLPR